MRNSLLLVGLSFSVLAIAAGCSSGGGTGNPATAKPSASASSSASASASPTSSASAAPTSSASSSATSAAQTWTFSGGGPTTATFTAGVTPAPVTITAGGDVTVQLSVQFAAPTSSGSLTFSTAYNGGMSPACCSATTADVSPNTLPADNATAGNDPFVYISIYNAGTSSVAFGSSTPAISVSNVTGNALAWLEAEGGCEFDYYETNGGTSTWTPIPGASFTFTGPTSSFTIPAATLSGGNTVTFKPGQGIGAISCN